MRTESRLNTQGITMQFQDVVRLLTNRLGFQHDVKRHPEMLADPITKPVIIIGLPRSGTSKLHRMMGADPGVQRPEMWRLFLTSPLPGTEGVKPDARIAVVEQMAAMLQAQFPALMARHAMEAREPDEEIWLHEMTFESAMSSTKTRAPNHRLWMEKRSQRKPYAYMRSLLQYLQWQDGGARGRPWILKSPFHIGELPTLLETFPDATIVYCHRDPRTVVPSFASLIELTHGMHSDEVDPVEIGLDFNQYWGRQTARHLAARRELGEDRIVDVYYEDIRDQPNAVIAKIYAHAGRSITLQAQQAFNDYAARRPEGHFGKHGYTMERHGLSNAKIEAAFSEYIQRFFSSSR